MSSPDTTAPVEARLILFVGLVQFINILDFMMVMPLGPDFALALGIPAEHIGMIGGSYTLAAALTGLAASLFLDRFERKRALQLALLGLAAATACGALAQGTASLVAARVLAGMFGGPLSSLAVAMIADHIPPQRRGAAMGKVMGAHAAASVLGVPFGLELASLLGWRAPFVALALVALMVLVLARRFLPAGGNVIQTLSLAHQLRVIAELFRNPTALGAFGYMALAMAAGFMIIPNISAHYQMNLDYPRARLGLLYFCGGTVSFFAMRWVGRLVDRTSSTRVSLYSTALLIASIGLGFVWYGHGASPLLIFILFMVAMTSRNVAGQALSSKVPRPAERASFMSLQSSVMHMASAGGAFLSSQMLTHTQDGRLAGIEAVGALAIAFSLAVPFLFRLTERRVATRPMAADAKVPWD